MNISLLLSMAAQGFPDRIAIGRRGSGITYAQLLERAERVGEWVSRREVDHVALVDVNSEAVPALLFGAAIARRPFAPLNFRLADDRLSSLLERLAPVVAVAEDGAVGRVVGDGVEALSRTEFGAEWPECPRRVAVDASPEDVAVLLFTSGTTGEPKAAVLRQRHLVSYVISTVEYGGSAEDEAALVSVPAYHIAGVSAILSSVYGGRRLVYLPAFDADAWVALAREEQITHAMVVPTMLRRILEVLERDGEGLPALRHLSYGGGRMPLPVIEHALSLLPTVDFVNAYGLTETSSTVAVLAPEDHRLAVTATEPLIRRRLGSVGRPVVGIELEIRADDGSVAEAGQPGEIWVRGAQVSGEYAGLGPGLGAAWFNTRDVGRLDEGGFVYLEGRADDVIVRGGENLSPGEIEDALSSHPGVTEAAVVAMPDEEWGQVPIAAVIVGESASPSEDELRAWVRKRLRSSRVPERVVFLSELPYTDTGKLSRLKVRHVLARVLDGDG